MHSASCRVQTNSNNFMALDTCRIYIFGKYKLAVFYLMKIKFAAFKSLNLLYLSCFVFSSTGMFITMHVHCEW